MNSNLFKSHMQKVLHRFAKKGFRICLAVLLVAFVGALQAQQTGAVNTTFTSQGSAQLNAPDAVPAGTFVDVQWQGPGSNGDRIYLVPAGASASEWHWTYPVYPRDGNPLRVPLPLKVVPGNYVFRYVADTSNAILATRPLTVFAPQATLNFPAEVLPYQTFEVSWTGPDGPEDRISVATPDGHPQLPKQWTFTTDGSPLQLMAPNELGPFVVRYQMGGSHAVILEAKLHIVEVISLSGRTLTVTAGDPQFAGTETPPHQTQTITAGTLQFTGLGDVQHHPQTITAGTLQFTGLGDGQHQTQTISAGTLQFTGLGDAQHQTQTISAGTLQFTGLGGVSHQAQIIQAGTMQFTGVGEVSLEAQIIQAGTMQFTGVGDVSLEAQVIQAGTMQFTGLGGSEKN